jgi:hypothetical protein
MHAYEYSAQTSVEMHLNGKRAHKIYSQVIAAMLSTESSSALH